MKTEDKEKITLALHDIRKFKWIEDKDGGNDFKRGMASVAEVMLTILSSHGSSYAYQAARDELIRRSK